ncbi:hypothetical protein [uncultured Streptomyces sp.]|uniref:hypothetical protein n=1 Tax=uncultured Streptomyces sp. TaxID=174707 RepID=UPI0026164397|nr:hypothetical protein [uncultured Streptomyces sp.]
MADPWATPEDLRVHLRLDTIDPELAAAAISAAQTVVRGALRQHVDQVQDAVLHLVGTGRHIMNLPEMPVTGLASVTVDGTVLEAAAYRWNRHGILRSLGGCWPLDADITVVCTHGWATVPDVVARVCVQVAGRAWVNPKEAVASESLGDYSVSYDKQRTGQAVTDFEARILEPYARGPASR